jgi:hypothetical protein
MSLTKLSLVGNNLFLPVRESLVCDILARDGKIANFFYSVYTNHSHIPHVGVTLQNRSLFQIVLIFIDFLPMQQLLFLRFGIKNECTFQVII